MKTDVHMISNETCENCLFKFRNHSNSQVVFRCPSQDLFFIILMITGMSIEFTHCVGVKHRAINYTKQQFLLAYQSLLRRVDYFSL